MRSTYKLWLISFLVITVSACARNTIKPEVLPAVTLDNSEIFTVYSELVQRHYRIRVRLPGNYSALPQRNYPIILKVDGQWDFFLAANTVNCIYFDGQMPEAIVVGIDWGDVEGNIHQIRSQDLLPEPVNSYPNSGFAGRFTDALADEILPAIESKYRSNGERVLLGGSWGGLYTSYALLARPDAFRGAISIAPTYQTGMQALKKLVDHHRGTHNLRDKRLYIGVGSFDDVLPYVREFSEYLTAAQLPGLKINFELKEGYGHSGMNVPGYASGYRFIFERPEIILPAATLQSYSGVYKSTVDPAKTLRVRVAGKQLQVSDFSNNAINLSAQSETQFYHPGIFYELHFQDRALELRTFFGQEFYKFSSKLE